MNTTAHIPYEMQKYETYINEVLRTDLNNVCTELDKVNTDLAEYEHLTKIIKQVEEFTGKRPTYKTMMNIGCNFFMEAQSEELSQMLLDIGLGCYLEFPLVDASKFIDVKVQFLRKKQDLLHEKSAKIKAHIKLMLVYMSELVNTGKTQQNS